MQTTTTLLIALGLVVTVGCRTPGVRSELRVATEQSASSWNVQGYLGDVAAPGNPYEVSGFLQKTEDGVAYRHITSDHQLAPAVELVGVAEGKLATAFYDGDEMTVLTLKPQEFTAQSFSPEGEMIATKSFAAPASQMNVEFVVGAVFDGTILAVTPTQGMLKIRRLTNVRDASGRTTSFSMSDEVQWPFIADRGGISDIGNQLSFTTGYPGSLTLIDKATLTAQKGVVIDQGWYLNYTVRDGDRLFLAQTMDEMSTGLGWVSLAEISEHGVPILTPEAPVVAVRPIQNFPGEFGYKAKHGRLGSRLVAVGGKLYATVESSTQQINHLIWIDTATATYGGIVPTDDLGKSPSLRGTSRGRLVMTLRTNESEMKVIFAN